MAYHEAGHAVIAVMLGGEVLTVTLEPDDDDRLPERDGDVTIRWQHRGLSRRDLVQREILVCLAGPAAETIHLGETVDPQAVAEWRYDWALANQLAGMLLSDQASRAALLHRLLKELTLMLRRADCWQAISETADQLEAHETLDGQEVHQIVRRWIDLQ